jgi:hypothetical protein
VRAEKWLRRPRVRLTSSGPALEHQTPRYIPFGPFRQPPDRRTDVVLSLRYVVTVTCASLMRVFVWRSGWMDLASTKRRSGRLLSVTHLSTYHVVLRRPPDRRTDVVLSLRYVITVTCASLARVFGEAVGWISRAQNVDPAGS